MTITPMTKEAAQEWVDALEGPYADRKTTLALRDIDDCMCCLGVLADIRGDWDDDNIYHVDGEAEEPTADRLDAWGIPHGTHTHLADGEVHATGAQALIYINDQSNTFAPVIAEIKRMFIDGAES